MNLGQIIILNGVPRSGKSSIVKVIQDTFDGPWMNLGVDTYQGITPKRYWPGIGLRPGEGEKAKGLEALLPSFYGALYESIAAHSRSGLNVVTDIGHHDGYSEPLGILADCAKRLEGLPVLFVGVRCPVEVIMERRNAGQPGRDVNYATGTESEPIPRVVHLWQEVVHKPGIYDLEVDTSQNTPEECAGLIRKRLDDGPPPTAFRELTPL